MSPVKEYIYACMYTEDMADKVNKYIRQYRINTRVCLPVSMQVHTQTHIQSPDMHKMSMYLSNNKNVFEYE